MRTDELWDDDPPANRRPDDFADFAWGRTANPNTADGELQNIAAFSAGIGRLTGSPDRRIAGVIGFAVGIILSIVGAVRS
jgi:hypothetical protein